MDESKTRRQAILRYENGDNPKQIYQSLGRSKKLFFKWLKRYKSGDKNWWKEFSQNVFDKSFFRSQYFESFSCLVAKSKEFEIFHDSNHRYSTLEGYTPLEKNLEV